MRYIILTLGASCLEAEFAESESRNSRHPDSPDLLLALFHVHPPVINNEMHKCR